MYELKSIVVAEFWAVFSRVFTLLQHSVGWFVWLAELWSSSHRWRQCWRQRRRFKVCIFTFRNKIINEFIKVSKQNLQYESVFWGRRPSPLATYFSLSLSVLCLFLCRLSDSCALLKLFNCTRFTCHFAGTRTHRVTSVPWSLVGIFGGSTTNENIPAATYSECSPVAGYM